MRCKKRKMLSAFTKLEERAAQLEAGAADLSGVIRDLLVENQLKDKQIARLSDTVERKKKIIDAMQCASTLILLHNS